MVSSLFPEVSKEHVAFIVKIQDSRYRNRAETNSVMCRGGECW